MASAFYVSVLYCSCLSAEKLKKHQWKSCFLSKNRPKTSKNTHEKHEFSNVKY